VGRFTVASVILILMTLVTLPACSRNPKPALILTGIDWQWTLFTVTSPASQTEIPDPTRYTISFERGGVEVKADCNSGSGSYEATGTSMTINISTMTLAQCPAGSMSDDFVTDLHAVDSYHLEDGRLALELKDDAGEMRFLDGGAVPPAGLS
jgi:heat shock protein HslJ